MPFVIIGPFRLAFVAGISGGTGFVETVSAFGVRMAYYSLEKRFAGGLGAKRF